MSNWAQLDDNDTVIQVTVGDNNDPNGDEGYKWLIDNLGGRWIKTSYNTFNGVHKLGGIPLRQNYAGIGFKYLKDFDVFIPPQPYPSWKLNYQTFTWEAPIPQPESIAGYDLIWSEINKEWVPKTCSIKQYWLSNN